MIKMISPIGVIIRTSEDRVEAMKGLGYRISEPETVAAPVEPTPEKKTRPRSTKTEA